MDRCFNMILAISDDGAIGTGNSLPWNIPDDLRNFKKLTTGHAIIMGRKTFDTIGSPLPNRRNIVVTAVGSGFSGCEVARTPMQAAEMALESDPEPFIIGGATIYTQLWDLAKAVYVTEVHAQYPAASIRFNLDRSGWMEVSREPHVGFDFVKLER